MQSEIALTSYGSAAITSAEAPPAVTTVASSTSLAPTGVALSPVAVTPVACLPNLSLVAIYRSSTTPTSQSAVTSAVGVQAPIVTD